MERLKAIVKKLIYPPKWLMVVLFFISAALLTVVFVRLGTETPLAYVSYVLSAYTLTVICISFSGCVPELYVKIKNTKERVCEHPLAKRYMTDEVFKVGVSMNASLLVNIGYSTLKLISGIVYSSFWWGAIAFYYILLALLRFSLLHFMRKQVNPTMIYEYKQYRICGVMMLVLNLSLTVIVFLMVWENEGYTYPGPLIFAVGAYTFYTMITSVIDIVKYRKLNSPILSASKTIKMAAALVSLLSLETAMLAQFGNDEKFRLFMTAISGTAVCVIVMAMSIYMIVTSNKEIKKLQTADISE